MVQPSILNALGFLIVMFSLNACGTSVKPIEISTTPVSRPQLTLPNVDELNLKTVTWTVITVENFEEKIAQLQSSGQPLVLFAVTADGYEALSLNLNDLRSQVEQLNAIIVAYRNYYVESDKILGQAVLQSPL
jgi:hypothetical protein